MERILKMLCFFGCCFQLATIAKTYLLYLTSTRMEIDMPEHLPAPDSSYCVSFADIFDYERYKRVHRKNVPFKKGKVVHNILGIVDNVLVKDIYEFTLNASNLIDGCWIRNPHSYRYVYHNKSDCSKKFEIDKYMIDQNICYRFHLKGIENDTFKAKYLAHSLVYPGEFFSIKLNTKILGFANRLQLIVHDAGLPRLSIASSEITFRIKAAECTLNYYVHLQVRLPPPYHTNCFHYPLIGFDSREECRSVCLEDNLVKKHQKVPSSVITTQQYNLSFAKTYLEPKIAAAIIEINKNCSHKCKYNTCTLKRSITTTSSNAQSDYTTVRFPREPFITITHSPVASLIDLIIYVTSTLGSWFGVSLLGLMEWSKESSLKMYHKFARLL